MIHRAPMHRRPPPSPIRLVAPVVLVLIIVSSASCSGTGTRAVAATDGAHRTAEPSAGCGRPLPQAAVPGGEERVESLHAGAQSGSYDLSVPSSYRDDRPNPVILLFYGFGSDPAQFTALTRIPSRGARAGFMVVVPHTQGAESEWDLSAHGADAGFVDNVVASVESTYCVDRGAVFAAGFSAGAVFAIVYSCARERSIAGIATAAGEFQLGCTEPMSILAFHGTDDPLVPNQNGAIGLSLPGVKVRGTQRNMGDWARLDHCRSHPQRSHPGSQVTRQQWLGCARGTSVVLYTITGGGHSWPGADPELAVGLTTQQVSATSQVLLFFGRLRQEIPRNNPSS